MEKKNIDWAKLGFAYTPTDYRYQDEWENGAWEGGKLITDKHISLLESACVFHYSQSCFEGLKAYTTKQDRHLPSGYERRTHVQHGRPSGNAELSEGKVR